MISHELFLRNISAKSIQLGSGTGDTWCLGANNTSARLRYANETPNRCIYTASVAIFLPTRPVWWLLGLFLTISRISRWEHSLTKSPFVLPVSSTTLASRDLIMQQEIVGRKVNPLGVYCCTQRTPLSVQSHNRLRFSYIIKTLDSLHFPYYLVISTHLGELLD